MVYAGTASKSLAPGLRLGWLVVPPAMLEELIAVKAKFGMHNRALDQLALARHIESGRPAEHAFTTAVNRLCAALAEAT